MKSSMVINVKMPTIVDILTFISIINASGSLKAKQKNWHFSFYEQLNQTKLLHAYVQCVYIVKANK